MTRNQHAAAALRQAYEQPAPMTVGIEEELLVCDPESWDLAPRAEELVDGDQFVRELPAAQIEIRLPPQPDAAAVERLLERRRRELARRAADRGLRLAGAGLHPFSAALGAVSDHPQYARSVAEFGPIVRRQLVFALQVHVCVRGPDRVLAVHNALRGHLPDIAALAANAPFHEGRDTGTASYRPKVAELLPRQGIPPAILSWEWLADALEWMPHAGRWWWELSPRPQFGTLEVRVPDTQITAGDAAAVAAFVHALVAWLAGRFDGGEPLPCPDRWRIEENRWSACRWGLDGTHRDLATGEPVPMRRRLQELLEAVQPFAERQGAHRALARARRLAERNGAIEQRRAAEEVGIRGLPAWLAERFSG